MNVSRWRRERQLCRVCRRWRDRSDDDRCIRRTAGVKFACCGHDESPALPGYFFVERGVVRFAAGIHPFLLQASVGRFIRTGHVAPFMYTDDESQLIEETSPGVWKVRLPSPPVRPSLRPRRRLG